MQCKVGWSVGAEVEWEERGPRNRRHYWAVRGAWAAARGRACRVRALLQLFGSAAFCRLLADCTDLLISSVEGLELQRWRAQDFTVSAVPVSVRLYLPRSCMLTCVTVPADPAPRAVPAAPARSGVLPRRA